MTPLEKPVHRKTRGFYRVLYQRPKQIVVSLMPGDLLEFREAGARTRFSIPVDSVFRHAVKLNALRLAAEKRARRKAKKEGAL